MCAASLTGAGSRDGKTAASRREVVPMPRWRGSAGAQGGVAVLAPERLRVRDGVGTPPSYRNVVRRGFERAAESAGLNGEVGRAPLARPAALLRIDARRGRAGRGVRVAPAWARGRGDHAGVYAKLFDRARHADAARAAMEARYGAVLEAVALSEESPPLPGQGGNMVAIERGERSMARLRDGRARDDLRPCQVFADQCARVGGADHVALLLVDAQRLARVLERSGGLSDLAQRLGEDHVGIGTKNDVPAAKRCRRLLREPARFLPWPWWASTRRASSAPPSLVPRRFGRRDSRSRWPSGQLRSNGSVGRAQGQCPLR